MYSDDVIPYIIVASVLIEAIGVYLVRFGLSLSSSSQEEIIESIKDCYPVLYLRSFLDDSKAKKKPIYFPFTSPINIASEEEQLVYSLNKFGPVVAVGNPGEKLRKLGAERLYFEDPDWKPEVGALIEQSRLVVLRAGFTKHFWWEVRQVLKECKPDKFLFLLPKKHKDICRFIVKLEELLNIKISLPDETFFVKHMGCSVGGILWFDKKWRPRFSAMQMPMLVSPFRHRLSVLFESGMREFFDSHDVCTEEKNCAFFGKRFLAIIVEIITMSLFIGIAILFEVLTTSKDGSFISIAFLLFFIYIFAMEISRNQGTLSKSICGVEIRDIGGGKPSFGQIFFRNLIKIAMIPSGLFIICFLLMLFRKPMLHDFASSTRILERA